MCELCPLDIKWDNSVVSFYIQVSHSQPLLPDCCIFIWGRLLTNYRDKYIYYKVGSILDFSFDIDTDTGQKTSDSISIFSISVE